MRRIKIFSYTLALAMVALVVSLSLVSVSWQSQPKVAEAKSCTPTPTPTCTPEDGCEPECQWFLTDRLLGEVYDVGQSQSWPMYEMIRGNSTLPEGDVYIPAGESCIWRADKSTPEPAAFGSDQWTAKIMLREAPCGGDDFHVYVGYILPGAVNEFTVRGTGEAYKVTGQGRIWWFKVNWAPGGLTVPAGGWLAFKVVNETCRNPLKVRTGQSDGWIKPEGCPSYPVPELTAGILFGSGVLGLAGYMLLNRKRLRVEG